MLLDHEIKLSIRKDSEHEKGTDIREYQCRVGKLMYAILGTRPDLAYAVSTLGRFSSDPSTKHAGALKRVLRKGSEIPPSYSVSWPSEIGPEISTLAGQQRAMSLC